MSQLEPFPRAVALDHIRSLAKQYGLTIRWAKHWWESLGMEPNVIVIPRPWSGKLYLVALHEIGHFVDPLAVKHWETTRIRDYLVSEAAASGWAVEHILPDCAISMVEDDYAYLGQGAREHGGDMVRRRREALLR